MEENLVYSNIINPGDVIAVGDIHGCMDLYQLFLDHVKDSEATVILLGDLIDRGPEDMAVLNRTRDLLRDPESNGLQAFYALRGNHEQMFLDAAKVRGWYSDLDLWVQNGGDYENLSSMREHVHWILDLPLYMVVGNTMFVHAGVSPGEDPAMMIANGDTKKLVWIRYPFLAHGPQFELWTDKLNAIVFGHSPFKAPDPYEIPGGGICIDSGAYHTGVLTSYNATQKTFTSFTTTS
jgi:serine/threonine protein phosphatase 1